MEDQQRLNNLVNEINVYRQQAELIQQQLELIQASIAEVDALFATLEDIEGKESVEAFVPVGAGSFIKGELKSTDEIIVSIGAGIAVKKDADGAREILEGQKEQLLDSRDKMLANLQQVTDMVGNLQAQAEQIAAAAQGNITQMG
nr:prefoldin subunit alpha [uncultured Methanobrevibacter sp.]